MIYEVFAKRGCMFCGRCFGRQVDLLYCGAWHRLKDCPDDLPEEEFKRIWNQHESSIEELLARLYK